MFSGWGCVRGSAWGAGYDGRFVDSEVGRPFHAIRLIVDVCWGFSRLLDFR